MNGWFFSCAFDVVWIFNLNINVRCVGFILYHSTTSVQFQSFFFYKTNEYVIWIFFIIISLWLTHWSLVIFFVVAVGWCRIVYFLILCHCYNSVLFLLNLNLKFSNKFKHGIASTTPTIQSKTHDEKKKRRTTEWKTLEFVALIYIFTSYYQSIFSCWTKKNVNSGQEQEKNAILFTKKHAYETIQFPSGRYIN